MGEENPFEGNVKLYIGEQEVDPTPHELVALDYEIPSQERLMAFDPAQEGEDKTGVNVWNNGSIELTFTISSEDNPVGKWYWNMVRRFRRERKALLWALTHGFTLRIPCCDENGNEGYFDLTLPSQLRQVMRITKFIPQYRIYDRFGCRYVVRKGKVVRMKVWPDAQKLIDKYEKEWEKRYEQDSD